jgi:hypothetical protein
MGKRISGTKIIVIDEISLTCVEDFYKQHIAYSRALSTLIECQIEEQRMLETPFDRLHVIIVGDFYQLKCVQGTPFFSTNITNEKAEKRRDLWEQLVYHYIELTEN